MARPRDTEATVASRLVVVWQDDHLGCSAAPHSVRVDLAPVSLARRSAGRRHAQRPQPVGGLLAVDHNDPPVVNEIRQAVDRHVDPSSARHPRAWARLADVTDDARPCGRVPRSVTPAASGLVARSPPSKALGLEPRFGRQQLPVAVLVRIDRNTPGSNRRAYRSCGGRTKQVRHRKVEVLEHVGSPAATVVVNQNSIALVGEDQTRLSVLAERAVRAPHAVTYTLGPAPVRLQRGNDPLQGVGAHDRPTLLSRLVLKSRGRQLEELTPGLFPAGDVPQPPAGMPRESGARRDSPPPFPRCGSSWS